MAVDPRAFLLIVGTTGLLLGPAPEALAGLEDLLESASEFLVRADSSATTSDLGIVDLKLLSVLKAKTGATSDSERAEWDFIDTPIVTLLEYSGSRAKDLFGDESGKTSFKFADLKLGSVFSYASQALSPFLEQGVDRTTDTQVLTLPVLGSLFALKTTPTHKEWQFLYLIRFHTRP